ncbi:DUF6288 domain-containing protein [Haloferula sp. A504]|uniref:DUF6288 domain-containing protein n=1 Tax=Haloferula sp. A504 TaxID=3373601 RepID=UPI0031C219EE|nr:DUF6288 domain-containing protein [Verrucomicrobiaceae bacterium E54]
MKRMALLHRGPLLRSFALAAVILTLPGATSGGDEGDSHYDEHQVYQLRPRPDLESPFGHVGATGLILRIFPGVVLKVEDTMPGSPAAGKFKTDEIITAINGVTLKGRNPFVAIGDVLTKSEATDGKVVFDVSSADGEIKRKETVDIPVLGTYGKSWPIDCEKSRKIVEQAAEFYADSQKFDQEGIPGALACLFLLSTGDDQYLPHVKEYFDRFPEDVNGIGDHTWNNGYNGIACGEYYLRSGDKSVLPILQYYCDDAKKRQKFGSGWTHWGNRAVPGYVEGGLLNAAGAQVLTTLLLGKECGLKVDDETLLGALRMFYRFAGRGTVPYGDHRGEGGLGSNGKDGMIAAAMQIATHATGDVTIYKEARDHLAYSMLTSYPVLVVGHGDEGRGDGIWRSLISSYLMDRKPDLYRRTMDRLTWWHDLSREPGGSIGIGALHWEYGKVGSSGAGVGLSYTAPRRTLRITGAPRSKFSHDFTLPEHLWGTEADRAFLSIEHNPKYYEYGKEEPIHVPFWQLGGAYHKAKGDVAKLPREVLLKNVHHARYMIRAQAAKALRRAGALDELERLLRDPDPRVRRAALDGLIDWNYYFGTGPEPISTEHFSPAMLEAIRKMLSDSEESWWVVDGALRALKFAPVEDLKACYPLIKPWTDHSDWWLREAAFMGLSGLERDDQLYVKILPKMMELYTAEYHTQPRNRMLRHLRDALGRKGKASPAGKLILTGLKEAVEDSEIKPGTRAAEGAYNVNEVARFCLQTDPTTALPIAHMIRERFDAFDTGDLIELVATPNSIRERQSLGLCTALDKLDAQARRELTALLANVYRRELIKRLKEDLGVSGSLKSVKPDLGALRKYGENGPLLDAVLDLTRLDRSLDGWTPVGEPKPADRVWRFTSFDPQREQDRLHPREKKRFRDLQLPGELKGWYSIDYDAGKWREGRAPIGKGECRGWDNESFENRSEWGDGEFLVMRTTFEVDDLDDDVYRLNVLARQGYSVYLNGHLIHTYPWWKDIPHYRSILLGSGEVAHLRKGANVLAAYGNVEYDDKTGEPRGQMDLFIEGLKMADLE